MHNAEYKYSSRHYGLSGILFGAQINKVKHIGGNDCWYKHAFLSDDILQRVDNGLWKAESAIAVGKRLTFQATEPSGSSC